MDILIYVLIAIFAIVPLTNASIAIDNNLKKARGEEVKATTLSNIVLFVTMAIVSLTLGVAEKGKMPLWLLGWGALQIIPTVSNAMPETFVMPLWANSIALAVHILGGGYGIYKFLK